MNKYQSHKANGKTVKKVELLSAMNDCKKRKIK